MQPAQDFKRLGDGDDGPNTGGMGAYTPLPWAPPDLVDEVRETVLQPTVDEMARRGTPFVGPALRRSGADRARRQGRSSSTPASATRRPAAAGRCSTARSARLLYAAATGRLADVEPLRWRSGAAVAVVMAAAGYPGVAAHRRRDRRSRGRRGAARGAGAPRGHRAGADGELVTAGGRVLAVTATGADARPTRGPGVRRGRRDRLRRRAVPYRHRGDIAGRRRRERPGSAGVGCGILDR